MAASEVVFGVKKQGWDTAKGALGLRKAAEGSILGWRSDFGGRGTGAVHVHTPVSYPFHGSIASPIFTREGDIVGSVVRRLQVAAAQGLTSVRR